MEKGRAVRRCGKAYQGMLAHLAQARASEAPPATVLAARPLLFQHRNDSTTTQEVRMFSLQGRSGPQCSRRRGKQRAARSLLSLHLAVRCPEGHGACATIPGEL